MIPSAATRMPMRVPTGLARVAATFAAVALVLCSGVAPAAAHPRHQEDPNEDTGKAPLAVSIASITPSTVPASGEVTLTGEVTNRSDGTWTDLRVYLFMSDTPMTTTAELREAARTPETMEVGGRLTNEGLYDEVGALEPGESAGYALSVPRRDLPITGSGVYWLGVHVLGTNEEGRIDGADGRARTFIASMPPRGRKTTLAVAVPLRAHVRRTPEGKLANVKAWERLLADDGRLTRLLDMARSSSDTPLTWVADPAVLDAIRSLSGGNPTFDISPTDDETTPGASPSADVTPSEGAESSAPEGSEGGDPTEGTDDEVPPGALPAESWLTAFTELVSQQTVLTLPYGDADVATLLRRGFDGVYDRTHELGAQTMEDLGIAGEPVVAPANGLLPNAALPALDPDTTVMLSERVADTDATTVGLPRGPDALLTSDAAEEGGPSPTPRYDALAIRQRILAEAAVRGLGRTAGRPLVVTTPDTWDPGADWATASFFTGLDVPWIRLVDVPFARILSRRGAYDGRLRYPPAVRKHEVPVANVLATRELDQAGSVLAGLLTRNDTIDAQVGRAAMLGSSTNARRRPRRSLDMTRNISTQVHGRLEAVTVEGSPLVTMSSGTGNMTVRVVNGLDEPVTVGIDADTGTDELRIRPPDLVSLGAGQRASVRLAVTATGTGFHSVRIRPTTEDGRALGSSTKVKVRSSQVGFVIWLIMGTGGVVFVAAIAARIVRRVRERAKADDREQDAREQEDIVS